jgi:hypothetical protein
MLGLWLTGMIPMENPIMLYLALEYTSANDIQVNAIWRTKHIFVLEAINCLMGLTSSRLMSQLSNGPLWLMIILEILLGLKSKQGNVLCAFLHGDLEPGETVYVAMSLGFS